MSSPSSSSSSSSSTPPAGKTQSTQPSSSSQLQFRSPIPRSTPANPSNSSPERRHPSLESLTPQQQQLFQAYLHGVRSGHIPMPSVALPNQASKVQLQANHSRTISDAKK